MSNETKAETSVNPANTGELTYYVEGIDTKMGRDLCVLIEVPEAVALRLTPDNWRVVLGEQVRYWRKALQVVGCAK